MTFWLCIALSVLAGFGSGVQGPANASVARYWDLSRSVALNGAIVFLGALLGVLFFRRDLPSDGARPPIGHMIGGFCGLLVISAAAFSVPKIGASVFTAALLLGMVVASLATDHYGWFGQATAPITPLRLAGVVLIAAGVALVKLTG